MKESTVQPNICAARTFLFVPGHRPEWFEKAAKSGADCIVLDLEDGVPADQKGAAREAISLAWGTLSALGVPVVIRINSIETEPAKVDLNWLGSGSVTPAALMVPKA